MNTDPESLSTGDSKGMLHMMLTILTHSIMWVIQINSSLTMN